MVHMHDGIGSRETESSAVGLWPGTCFILAVERVKVPGQVLASGRSAFVGD